MSALQLDEKPARSRIFETIRSQYGLVFAWLIVIVLATIATPQTFLNPSTLSGILGSQAVLLFLSLGVLFPLSAGDYDLSIGGTLSATSIVLAILNVQLHVNIGIAIVIALLLGAAIGAINGLLVVVFDIDSFIVTLGMATILGGISVWVSNSSTITGVSAALTYWTFETVVFSIPLTFYYGIAGTALVVFILGYTTFGRRLLYIGRGREVARLNGVSVGSSRLIAFVISGVAAALAGLLYVGTTGSASPSLGNSYLLPAYAAAFLGATAIIPGRFNGLGTLVAVYFLGTGITAITLLGADSYVQSLFYGGAVIIAVISSRVAPRNGLAAKFRTRWQSRASGAKLSVDEKSRTGVISE